MYERLCGGMRDSALIVIGRDADALLRYLPANRLATFRSIASFDRWRAEADEPEAAQTIGGDVDAALASLGRTVEDLDGDLRTAIDRLVQQPAVPFVRDFVPDHVSERTFYRRWRAVFDHETPKRFLARVRRHHAHRLIHYRGLPAKEAAWRAGFASAWHLRQSMNSNGHGRQRVLAERASYSRNTSSSGS